MMELSTNVIGTDGNAMINGQLDGSDELLQLLPVEGQDQDQDQDEGQDQDQAQDHDHDQAEVQDQPEVLEEGQKDRMEGRFRIEPINEIDTIEMDGDRECNHFLFNDYFKEDIEDCYLLNPYDLLMRLQFPFKKSVTHLEKFKNYWENYSFYAIWRRKFIQDHSCDEQDIWKEFFIASVPHLIINLFLVFYIIGGAVVFQIVDTNIRQNHFHMVIMFTFTTVATVGYGNIVPTTDASKVFCIFYTLMGVPLLFLSLTNIGQFIAEAYWIFLASLSRTQDVAAADERRLPLRVVVTLLLTHSLIGGILFHFWIDQMPIIPAIYFCFVSITTIGYGDITPTPSSAFQTFIIICYLAIGMVIMSTFVAALYNYLRRLHYLGRNFSGAANVEVWFGGTRMSVTELLHIVAEQFDVSPKVLYDVLRDLDDIITAATDPHAEANIEVGGGGHGGGGRRSNRSSSKDLHPSSASSNQTTVKSKRRRKKCFKTIEVQNSVNNATQTHILIKSDSELSINKLPESERENVIQALGMLHHITRTKSNIRERRSSSASARLRSCKDPYGTIT